MDYRLELLDSKKFEDLSNTICQNIFGTGIIIFGEGKDGGKDGKFIGIAENYPSKSKPWEDTTIIQCKHTTDYKASCSDSNFERQILKEECPKILKLKEANQVDNYMIFTNRVYSGVKGDQLIEKIRKATKLDNVAIIGKEKINSYLNQNKDIRTLFKLDNHHIAFDFSDDEIKDIILEFKNQLPLISKDISELVLKFKYDFDKIKIEEKNKINKLGSEYYQNEILSKSLMEFDKIEYFLQNDINSEFKDYYFDIATELSNLITLKRDDFSNFEEIFILIYQKVTNGSSSLKGSKRHLLTLLHYMYFSCLIGMK